MTGQLTGSMSMGKTVELSSNDLKRPPRLPQLNRIFAGKVADHNVITNTFH